MARVQILFATMTGTAELVAEELMDHLSGQSVDCSMDPMDTFDVSRLKNLEIILICTSTTGEGEVPDNGLEFHRYLRDEQPDLRHIRFGVCGLGDSSYSATFNAGGAQFEAALISCGAVKIGERMLHDASSDVLPEDQAVGWCDDWLRLLSLSDQTV